ncbi:Rrf2 family transcriptional regulator [Gilvimarinus chinensis]|uniref:Rrf2 family transcriptional regulator n=1 Tax=Gilvimarinus chinensis TaxID=396005 RepID=UPI00035DEA8A|nr:Rrf2 family transcriptional regulator [Gilvimarinus chinensis]
MKTDSRLSGVLHMLLHMAEFAEPMPSDALAKLMNTNPVVVRRLLGALRKRGWVSSEKGPGGGWRLVIELQQITFFDVYDALEAPRIFAIGHRDENSGCLVEKAVNDVMGDSLQAAELLLLERFKNVSLADIQRQIQPQLRRWHECRNGKLKTH